jgi:hypothetical protein
LLRHPEATAQDILRLPTAKPEPNPRQNEPVPAKGEPRKTQATELIELTEPLDLFHSDDDVYVAIEQSAHRETWPLRSPAFRSWLARQYYLKNGRAPGSQAVEDALRTLSAKAQFEGTERGVHIRVAEHDGRIYVDLGDEDWRAVEIDERSWRVVDRPPVHFVRRPGMRPLPTPKKGGSLDALWDLLNVDDPVARSLILGWLVQCLRPRGAYPTLVLQGEQGTAKSTCARILRTLVDPSRMPIRSPPRNEEDLAIAARNTWVLALDNLSGVPMWLSDALCRLGTGGGIGTRQRYTDVNEVLINVQRPIVLNGIDDIATRQDLLDRALVVILEPITEDRRRSEEDLWVEFEQTAPGILGCLLDAVSKAIQRLPEVQLTRLPRMADFARWVTAAEPALGMADGAFLRSWQNYRDEALVAALADSPVAMAVKELVRHQGRWRGTATELLTALERSGGDNMFRDRYLPRTPNRLSNHLRRLAPALRQNGVRIEFSRGRHRTIALERDQKSWSPSEGTGDNRPVEEDHRRSNDDPPSLWSPVMTGGSTITTISTILYMKILKKKEGKSVPLRSRAI